MKRKAALHNLGCKVNAYELEAMQQSLEKAGYEIVPFAPGADLYVINTCTVTNIADRKSRQMLHRARKMNPNAIVVATGCAVQAQKEGVQKDPAIDIVIGNDQKKDILTILERYHREEGKKDYLLDLTAPREYEELFLDRTEGHTRAFVKVQDGCNQFCSYCIIPYARGRVRSRELQNSIEECTRLAASGVKEIVLTGIHLSSYGVDLPEEINLLDLIRAVHAIEGVERIRLGSLEPGIITEEFAKEIAAMPKVCPHFHLSLQSGCDKTLKRMNRKYTADEYREKCRILRSVYDMPALTTDVITGFPGETEEDFAASVKFVDEISFFETHVFPYSRREGTRAAAFPDQLTEAVKKERSRVLLELHKEKQRSYIQRFLGRYVEVLFEESFEKDGKTYWTGHTPEYLKCICPSEEDLTNTLLTVYALEENEGEIYCTFDERTLK